MEELHPDHTMQAGTVPSGHGFLHLMLVAAVLLSSALGILLVMRDTGTDLFAPKPGRPQTPAAAVVSTTEEEKPSGTEEQADPAEADAGTSASDASGGASDAGEAATGRKYAEKKGGEETAVAITFADAIVSSRLTGHRVFLLEGYDNPGGAIVAEAETDHLGTAKFSVPDGGYTLVWDIPGFVKDYDNLTVGNEGERGEYYRDSATDYVFWKWILPVMQENGRYIVMEWKGAEDLDLCVFNARTKEFITVVNPMDSDGNFLYQDDYSGTPGMEVVKINDAASSAVYAPYVRDGKSLQRGAYSAMEATGVRVSIYSGTELLTRQEADTAERAGLWNPCYIYEGRVYQEGSYVYDPGKYMWAAFDKSAY